MLYAFFAPLNIEHEHNAKYSHVRIVECCAASWTQPANLPSIQEGRIMVQFAVTLLSVNAKWTSQRRAEYIEINSEHSQLPTSILCT